MEAMKGRGGARWETWRTFTFRMVEGTQKHLFHLLLCSLHPIALPHSPPRGCGPVRCNGNNFLHGNAAINPVKGGCIHIFDAHILTLRRGMSWVPGTCSSTSIAAKLPTAVEGTPPAACCIFSTLVANRCLRHQSQAPSLPTVACGTPPCPPPSAHIASTVAAHRSLRHPSLAPSLPTAACGTHLQHCCCPQLPVVPTPVAQLPTAACGTRLKLPYCLPHCSAPVSSSTTPTLAAHRRVCV